MATTRREAEAVVAAAVGNPDASPVTVGEARLLLAQAALAGGDVARASADLAEARRLLAGDRATTLRSEIEALAARLPTQR